MNEYCNKCGKVNDTFCQNCTKCFNDFAPHTKKCVDLNDLSFVEICICEDLMRGVQK